VLDAREDLEFARPLGTRQPGKCTRPGIHGRMRRSIASCDLDQSISHSRASVLRVGGLCMILRSAGSASLLEERQGIGEGRGRKSSKAVMQ
jgi:hypothetical protein